MNSWTNLCNTLWHKKWIGCVLIHHFTLTFFTLGGLNVKCVVFINKRLSVWKYTNTFESTNVLILCAEAVSFRTWRHIMFWRFFLIRAWLSVIETGIAWSFWIFKNENKFITERDRELVSRRKMFSSIHYWWMMMCGVEKVAGFENDVRLIELSCYNISTGTNTIAMHV